MVLDEAMPRWRHRERHQLPVPVPTDDVMRAVHELTWREVPLFRALMVVRFLGRPPLDRTVFDWFTDFRFVVLHDGDDEVVVGAIERVAPGVDAGPLAPRPEALREFDEPGYVKIGFCFRHEAGVLAAETRVLATDPRSARRFAVYWALIRGGSGLIRRDWLRAIRARALR